MNCRALDGRVVELLRVVDPSSRDVSSPPAPRHIGIRWSFACGAERDKKKKKNLKNSTAAPPSRNHEPLTRDETHTLLAAVFSLRVTAQQETDGRQICPDVKGADTFCFFYQ